MSSPDPAATPSYEYIDAEFIADATRKFEASGRSWSRPDGHNAPPLDHLFAFSQWIRTQTGLTSRDLGVTVVFGLGWSSSLADRLQTILRTRLFPDDHTANEFIETYKACGSIAETARRIESELSTGTINRGLYQEAFTQPDRDLLGLLYASGSGWAAGSAEEGADDLDEVDGTGWIYAYTFPAYQRLAEIDESPVMPIKVGMTRVTPEARVYGQTRTSHPEDPIILGTWAFADEATAYRVERSFQRRFANSTLSGRTVGTEWFNTSLDAVTAALSMASDLLSEPA